MAAHRLYAGETMRTVAALFVESRGCYQRLAGVDAWDKKRDARLYAGPHPVVAHPPCDRWGRYATGGPSVFVKKEVGADEGCFAAALEAVRTWGGVLEHPRDSKAWDAFGLFKPPSGGGWIAAGDGIGWCCCVEQGHYGHRAQKATWLYVAHVSGLPSLRWGRSAKRAVVDMGFHTAAERAAFYQMPKDAPAELRTARRQWLEARAKETGKELCVPERLNRKERLGTPIEFRDLLIEIARSSHVQTERRALCL